MIKALQIKVILNPSDKINDSKINWIVKIKNSNI